MGAGGSTYVVERQPGAGTTTPVATLTPAARPFVGIDSAGTATVAWSGIATGLRVVRIPAGGTPEPVQTFEPTSASDTSLSVAPDGAAVLAWIDSSDDPHAAYRPAGATTFGSDTTLDATNKARNSTVTTITGAGRAIVAWQNITDTSIDFALRTPASGFTGVAKVYDSATSVFQPRLASDAAGNAYAIWLNAITLGTNEQIQYSDLAASSSTWSAKANVSQGGEDLASHSLDLASDPAGNLAAIWPRDSDDTIHSKLKPAGGAWPVGAGELVTASGTTGFFGTLAASDHNGFLVAWNQGNTGDDSAEAAFRSVGSAAWTHTPSLGSWETGSSDNAAIAIDPRGNAVVGFDTEVSSGPTTEAMQLAIGDGGAPPDLTLAAPATAVAGAPASFSLTASDFSGVASEVIAFGDGASAAGPAATHTYAAPGGFTVTGTATDVWGHLAGTDATIAVSDATAPVVSGLRLSRKRFAVGRASTPVSARRKVRRGTKISYQSSEAGQARLRIERRRRGFRRGRRCVAKRPRGVRRPRRCTRFTRAGTLSRSATAGSNVVRFSGRIGRRALKRGRYRLTLVVTDASGNESSPSRAGFRIVRG